MQITVKLSGTSLAAYADQLTKMGSAGRETMARALNEGGDRTRTAVRRALQAQMNTKSYGAVVKATSSKVASAGSLAYVIKGQGRGLPIKEFPTRYSKSKGAMVRWDPRKHYLLQPRNAAGQFGPIPAGDFPPGVISEPWAVTHAFKRSFVNAKGEPVAMRGSGRSIRRLYGPNPGKEIVKDQSLATFEQGVVAFIEPIITKRLLALLP